MSARSFRRAHARRLDADRRRAALRRRSGVVAGAAALGVALAPAAARADTTFQVTTNLDDSSTACAPFDPQAASTDECTLREAIDAANTTPGNDTITFQSGVTGDIDISENGPLYVNPVTPGDGLTIQGPGADTLAVTGADTTSILRLRGIGDNVAISGLTLKHASGQAIESGQKYGSPGFFDGPNLSLTDMTITDNSGDVFGAGVFSDGALTVTSSRITGNTSTTGEGGGIYAGNALTITGSTITGNTAHGSGGGVENAPKYFGGPALATGAARLISATPDSVITDSTISDNTAGGRGGGIASYNTSLAISGSTIAGNTAGTRGGGVYAENGALTVDTSTVSQNTALSGGGISAYHNSSATGSTSVGLTDSTLDANTATQGAGGGLEATGAAATVSGSTFSGNTAVKGGGLAADSGAPSIDNSTFTGNAAEGGGGLWLGIVDGSTLRDLTISGNAARPAEETSSTSFYGGGLALSGDETTITVEGSIIAGNTVTAGSTEGTATGPDTDTVGDDHITADHDLLGDTSATQFASTDATTDALVGKDPQLGALADNGGPTKTMKPGLLSPALDASVDFGLEVDQRGVDRPQNAGYDIGAVELRRPSATTGGASAITSDGATVAGTINVDGGGSYRFEYGKTASYGQSTGSTAAPSDAQDHGESAELTGLEPGTTYHYRVVASNDDATVPGADATFTTAAAPAETPPPTTSTPPPAPLPPQVLQLKVSGRCTTVAAQRKSGFTGPTFTYTLSEDATVTYNVLRRVDSPKRTVCPTPGGTASVKFKQVTTTTARATASRRAGQRAATVLTAGQHTATLAAIVGSRVLSRGSYLLTVVATNAAGTSKTVGIQFWVLSPKPKRR